VVKVQLYAFFKGKLRETFVIIILLKNDDVGFGKRFDDPAGDGGFPGASATANSDDERTRVERSNGWRSFTWAARIFS
jgi:hypothetical protein